MSNVLDLAWDDVIAAVEAAAATGARGAGRLLDDLLEHEESGGDTGSVILRLAAQRYIDGSDGKHHHPARKG